MANEKHYVKNDEFLAALIDYKTKCDLAEKEGKTEPPIPNYIGECFLKIAEHLSRKPNFISDFIERLNTEDYILPKKDR